MASSDTTEFFNRSKNRLDEPQPPGRAPTRQPQPKPNQSTHHPAPPSSPSTQHTTSPEPSDSDKPTKKRRTKPNTDRLVAAPPARNRARAIALRAQAAGVSSVHLSAPRPLLKHNHSDPGRTLNFSDSESDGVEPAGGMGSPGRASESREGSVRLPSLTALEEHNTRLREMAQLNGWKPQPGSALEKVMAGRNDEVGARGRAEGGAADGAAKAGGAAVAGATDDPNQANNDARGPSLNGDIDDPYDTYKLPRSRKTKLAPTSSITSRTPTSVKLKLKPTQPAPAKSTNHPTALTPSPSPPSPSAPGPVPFDESGPVIPPTDFWGVAGAARPAAGKGKKRQHGEATRALKSLSDMRNSVSGGLAEGLGMMSDDIICGDTEEESGGEGGKYETVAAKAKRQREEAQGKPEQIGVSVREDWPRPPKGLTLRFGVFQPG